MKFKSALIALTAMSMAAAPSIATAATPVSTASVQRSVQPVTGDNELAGRGGGFIIAIFAVAAIVAGIIVVASDNNDRPNSP